MTTAPRHLLVLKNETGDYYVLPEELLERGRVPAEHTTEAERIFAEAQTDDVAGHLNFTKITFNRQLIGTLVVRSTAVESIFSNPATAENGPPR